MIPHKYCYMFTVLLLQQQLLLVVVVMMMRAGMANPLSLVNNNDNVK